MFEQAFKNIDDALRKEAGCTTELDYTEQTSWLLFLKYLDALEHQKAMEAGLEGRKYSYVLDPPYRWEIWASPKDKHGKLDHNAAQTGPDLADFVNLKLFPYLHRFKQKASGPNTLEYKIGEIFGEIKNKIHSGYILRDIIDHIDELRFGSQAEKHELSHLYEAKIKNMGNAGRNGGEYYTPRPLIRAMVRVVQPKIGESIYDGAVGSAGFLCESFDYLRAKPHLTTRDLKTLQEKTFYGIEKKSLAYVIAIMNMILHGIETPNIVHANTLALNLNDVQDKDRFDVILANPPFGGKERKEVQQNFPIKTGETAFLFLQHFIKFLKAGGRAGVVIKNTFLSNTDNASVSLRKLLLESCNLHTVLDCPGGTFQGAGVKTVVLFFEKGAPTRKTWYYQLEPGRNMGKTNPLNDADLAEFIALQKTFADSPKSWSADAVSIDPVTFDLSVKNPNGGEAVVHRSPQDIMDEIAALDAESAEVLGNIRSLQNHLQTVFNQRGEKWPTKQLGEVCDFEGGSQPPKSQFVYAPKQGYVRFLQIRDFGSEKHITYIPESKKNRLCREDDIMIARYGASVGKILTGKAGAYNVALMKTTPDLTLLDRNFFYHYLISTDFQERLMNVASRSAQDGFSKEDINGFPVPVPPLKEQQSIVKRVIPLSEETQRLESLYQRKLAALDELKKSLLHQAFSGAL